MAIRLRVSLTAPGMSQLVLVQWLLASVLIAALSAAAGIWWHSQTLAEQIQHLERELSAIQDRNRQLRTEALQAGLDLSEARMSELPQEIDFAQQLQRLEGFSWTQFLNDLESAVPATVSLDSVVLNFKDSSIALRGTAKTLDDLNEFVENLEAHQAFHEVVLSRHAAQAVNERKRIDGRRVIVFSLTVLYERTNTVSRR